MAQFAARSSGVRSFRVPAGNVQPIAIASTIPCLTGLHQYNTAAILAPRSGDVRPASLESILEHVRPIGDPLDNSDTRSRRFPAMLQSASTPTGTYRLRGRPALWRQATDPRRHPRPVGRIGHSAKSLPNRAWCVALIGHTSTRRPIIMVAGRGAHYLLQARADHDRLVKGGKKNVLLFSTLPPNHPPMISTSRPRSASPESRAPVRTAEWSRVGLSNASHTAACFFRRNAPPRVLHRASGQSAPRSGPLSATDPDDDARAREV